MSSRRPSLPPQRAARLPGEPQGHPPTPAIAGVLDSAQSVIWALWSDLLAARSALALVQNAAWRDCPPEEALEDIRSAVQRWAGGGR